MKKNLYKSNQTILNLIEYIGETIPQRVVLSVMGFFALAVSNTMRSCLSMAITEMVAPPNKTGENGNIVTIRYIFAENHFELYSFMVFSHYKNHVDKNTSHVFRRHQVSLDTRAARLTLEFHQLFSMNFRLFRLFL